MSDSEKANVVMQLLKRVQLNGTEAHLFVEVYDWLEEMATKAPAEDL